MGMVVHYQYATLQQSACSAPSIMYMINLIGYETTQTRSCVSTSCTAVYTNFPMSYSEFNDLTIVASNHSNILKESRLTVGKYTVTKLKIFCLRSYSSLQ